LAGNWERLRWEYLISDPFGSHWSRGSVWQLVRVCDGLLGLLGFDFVVSLVYLDQ